ncbi:MAG: mandelate racemase/muconate lactonizing enzyme family protein [Akkermansiaceae bacterium]|nr:mandelate racemase/muconate lactonizing enzyme family protein [Akkermansiaceae bacterium]
MKQFFRCLLLVAAFLPCHAADTGNSAVMAGVMNALEGRDAKIASITAYAIPVDAERRFSYGVQKGRLHVFIRFTAGDHHGWTEFNASRAIPEEKIPGYLASQLKWYGELKGLSVAEALKAVVARRPQGVRELEAAEMAVLDLAGQLTGKPTIKLLGLTGQEPVPGVFCILSDDPAQVEKLAKLALEQKLSTHIKVKLYGKVTTDLAVIRAARKVIGPDAFLVGDVNGGYRPEQTDEDIKPIADALRQLHAAGLSACEDPAYMTVTQWEALQAAVGGLALLPDVPVRPAWSAPRQIRPGMGRIFNMHPACMGSVMETVSLGRLIQSWDRKLMVGDASLVGPACPAWTQMAIGLGADWVEAIEKPQENDVFQRCLLKNPVGRTPDGRFFVRESLPGWGIEIDEAKLRQLAAAAIEL